MPYGTTKAKFSWWIVQFRHFVDMRLFHMPVDPPSSSKDSIPLGLLLRMTLCDKSQSGLSGSDFG
jgi:hypothetical protein